MEVESFYQLSNHKASYEVISFWIALKVTVATKEPHGNISLTE